MKLQSDTSKGTHNDSDPMLLAPFDAALLAAEKLFRLRIHRSASKRDYVGVLLFGTRKKAAYTWQVTGEESDSKKTPKGRGGNNHHQELEDDDDDDDEDEDEEVLSGDESEAMDEYGDECDAENDVVTHTLLPLQSPSVEPILRLRQCLPMQSRTNCYYLGGSFIATSERKRDLEEELVCRSDNEYDAQREDTCWDPALSVMTALEAAMLMLQAKRYGSCRRSYNILFYIHNYDYHLLFHHHFSVRSKFQKSKDTKAIWIFTNDDNPFSGESFVVDRGRLLTLAEDIRDNGIKIQVWAMPTVKQDFIFDRSLFFDELLLGAKGKTTISTNNTFKFFQNVGDMLSDINVQSATPRKVQTVPLLLPDFWDNHMDDPCIMLDLFALVQIKRKPYPITVHQDTFKYVLCINTSSAVFH